MSVPPRTAAGHDPAADRWRPAAPAGAEINAFGASLVAPPSAVALREHCPLCGSEIDAAQDWCLRCGAAARTRLAATPRWWLPVSALSAIALISLGVLVAALVKLAA